MVAVNTSLAAAGGGISSLIAKVIASLESSGELSFDLIKALNGTLAGLVAITAGAATVEPWAAFVIGIIAGWIYLSGSRLLIWFRIDDAVDGVPIHMFGGMWGLLAVGLLSSPNKMQAAYGKSDHVGFFYSLGRLQPDGTLLLNEFLEILFILAWIFAMFVPFFTLLNRKGWLRVDILEELAGLDARYKHAVQEDHDELKKKIRQEYHEHKEAVALVSSKHSGGTLEGSTSPFSRSRHSSINTSTLDKSSTCSGPVGDEAV